MASAQMFLEIEEDEEFNQKNRKIERIGWAFMALFILGAVLGAFGPALERDGNISVVPKSA